MAELRLSEAARTDLEEIRRFGIENFGEQAAELHLQGVRRIFALLSQHPLSGQQRTEFAQDIRALSHRPHRIFYKVRGDTVLVIRVIHQARDVAAALRAES